MLDLPSAIQDEWNQHHSAFRKVLEKAVAEEGDLSGKTCATEDAFRQAIKKKVESLREGATSLKIPTVSIFPKVGYPYLGL